MVKRAKRQKSPETTTDTQDLSIVFVVVFSIQELNA